jgi:hypothetical protein
MQYGIIEPPSVMQDVTLILTVILCFILIVLAIWFAVGASYVPALFSMAGAVFIIWVIGAIKGAFK